MNYHLDWLSVVFITVGIILNNRRNKWFIVFMLLANTLWIIHSTPRGDYAMIVFCFIVILDNLWDFNQSHRIQLIKRHRKTASKQVIEKHKGESS